MDIALMHLPMSDHLHLQYDDQAPPLVLTLAADSTLQDLYHEAQKIYKDINLRVDYWNNNDVKILPKDDLEKFSHVMFISTTLDG